MFPVSLFLVMELDPGGETEFLKLVYKIISNDYLWYFIDFIVSVGSYLVVDLRMCLVNPLLPTDCSVS